MSHIVCFVFCVPFRLRALAAAPAVTSDAVHAFKNLMQGFNQLLRFCVVSFLLKRMDPSIEPILLSFCEKSFWLDINSWPFCACSLGRARIAVASEYSAEGFLGQNRRRFFRNFCRRFFQIIRRRFFRFSEDTFFGISADVFFRLSADAFFSSSADAFFGTSADAFFEFPADLSRFFFKKVENFSEKN